MVWEILLKIGATSLALSISTVFLAVINIITATDYQVTFNIIISLAFITTMGLAVLFLLTAFLVYIWSE